MRPHVALVIAVALLAAPDARAQSTTTLMPAISVSTAHDDNLFSAPSGVGDVVTYLRPSLEGQYESR